MHRPRLIFLDEPTTGLDPQSRAALWEEVARLRREDGVTVFLTTQYLEEADVLADRVGIIDKGRIVAEGTPADLKDEIGRPSVHAIPGPAGRPITPSPPRSSGSATPLPATGETEVAVRLTEGVSLADIVRGARCRRACAWTTSSCARRASTTSSSPRPAGRSRARRRHPRRPTPEEAPIRAVVQR